MKIFGTTKNKKNVELNKIDIQLKSSEIGNLIDFLLECQKSFTERKNDCSVTKVIFKNDRMELENISSYKKIKDFGYETIDCHLHYIDYIQKDVEQDSQITDIVVHTALKAKRLEDDSFIWIDYN